MNLIKHSRRAGVVATELYDYSGDSAAYSSALDAARNADDRTGDGSVSFRELPLPFIALLVKSENRPLSC